MYKLTALVLVSILSQSIAVRLNEESRHTKTINDEFNPLKYFNNTWYVTYALYVGAKLTPDDLACMKIENTLLTNGIVRETDTTYIPKNDTFLYHESYINVEIYSEGVYDSVARPIDKDGRPLVKEFYPLQNCIVKTDYDTYSFVITDQMIPNDKQFTIYYVLNREPAGPLNEMILSIMDELSLKPDDFTRINNDNCKEEKI